MFSQRQQLSAATDEDLEDRDDDLPTVVVLKKGDLSAEEAKVEIEKQQKDLGISILLMLLFNITHPILCNLFKKFSNASVGVSILLQMIFLVDRVEGLCSKNLSKETSKRLHLEKIPRLARRLEKILTVRVGPASPAKREIKSCSPLTTMRRKKTSEE